MDKQQMPLVSLLGERYALLRRESARLWNRREGISLTAAEWYVLGQIGDGRMTVAQLARTADMTRQAAHKYARTLADKELLILETAPGNRRLVGLTGLGKRCVAWYRSLQLRLELQLENALGKAEMERLTGFLTRDWESCLQQLEPVDDQTEF